MNGRIIRIMVTLVAASLSGCTGDDTVGADTDSATGSSGTPGSLTDTGPGNDQTTFADGTTDADTTADSSSDGSSSAGSSSEGSSSGGSSSGGSSSGGSSSEGSSSEGSSSEGTTGDTEAFEFLDADPADYTQIDRVGFAGTNTFMILLGDKDAYNEAGPLDDIAGTFDADHHDSINTWHRGIPGMQTAGNTGLDDDLVGSGIVPCITTQLPVDTCGTQIVPLIVPDVLRLDLTQSPGFPNGRLPQDPIADIVLAIVLIDLEVHPLDFFLDMDGNGTPGPSLNPLANDVAFGGAFPFLAPPHP